MFIGKPPQIILHISDGGILELKKNKIMSTQNP